MLIDLRQHVITLVAVFLALAVGIVLGSTFINGDSVERKVSGVLEKEFSKLRTENEDQQTRISQLSEQMRRQQEFDRSIATRLVDRRLANRSVAIIQTGDYDECVDSVRQILEKAGAEVRSVTVVSPRNENTDTQAAMAVRSISGEVDVDKPTNRALEILANSVVTGVNPHAVEILETKGLVKASGDYYRRTSLVVIVGGCKEIQSDLPSTIDSVLVDKIKAANVLEIVGVEPTDVGTSYIPAYRGAGISTVDDIDLPMGQIAMVYVLAGESGNYGVKKTADRLIPKELENGLWVKKSRR